MNHTTMSPDTLETLEKGVNASNVTMVNEYWLLNLVYNTHN